MWKWFSLKKCNYSFVLQLLCLKWRSIPVQLLCPPSTHNHATVGFTTDRFYPSLAEHDVSCLSKQSRSRSDGFWISQLIWICTVSHQICEFLSKPRIKKYDWLEIRSGCGFFIYSAREGLWCCLVFVKPCGCSGPCFYSCFVLFVVILFCLAGRVWRRYHLVW